MMGSHDVEILRWEEPVYQVTIGDFYIGKHPLIQAMKRV